LALLRAAAATRREVPDGGRLAPKSTPPISL
jgi:hypothetical protein